MRIPLVHINMYKFIMQKIGALLLSFAVCLLLSPTTDARRVDCTKFVFAPVCRGVAAKRAGDVVNRSDRANQYPVDRLLSETSGMELSDYGALTSSDDEDGTLTDVNLVEESPHLAPSGNVKDARYIRLATALWPSLQHVRARQRQSDDDEEDDMTSKRGENMESNSRLHNIVMSRRSREHELEKWKTMLRRLLLHNKI